MKILVKMVYLEVICMVKADSHVVREQCNVENLKGPAFCARSFVLISILRGQPRTPPSGDNIGVLDYHLKRIALQKDECTLYILDGMA